MSVRMSLLVIALAVAIPAQVLRAQTPVGTAFTYQGQLTKGGQLLSDTADLQFTLWDAATTPPGSQIGAAVYSYSVSVTDGLFTTTIDFGANVFQGDARWLEIAVRSPAGGGTYTTLSPRQPLTPAPYALALPGVWTEQISPVPNILGGYSGNFVTAGAFGATIGGGGQSGYENLVTDHFGTVGGGWGNKAGNGDGDVYSAQGATVGGGANNLAFAELATVGGGGGNRAWALAATIAGGQNNEANGAYGTVGGGYVNGAEAIWTTVAGGGVNTATGVSATIGGGSYNTASGDGATVPGGDFNNASGDHTFAAGYRARAIHDGAFVWADFTEADFGSAEFNEFAIRATGGLRVQVDSAGGGGLRVSPSGGTPNLIGGALDNEVSAGAQGAVVAGGGSWSTPNRVTDDFSVVAGGKVNQAGDGIGTTSDASCAVVTGGEGNIAARTYSTVGGGAANSASGVAATIAGGRWNVALAGATVGGGEHNGAWGEFGTVPGGDYNQADGLRSLAAGHRAKAMDTGSLVWADSTDADFSSFGNDTLSIRATGGAFLQAGSSVYGAQLNNSGTGDGMRIYSNSSGGQNWAALYAINYGTGSGVYGYSSQGVAGQFDGGVNVTGYLYKGGGGFKIDHPLDPQNKYLYHSFVESPDMKNVYDGVVTLGSDGRATVELPDWFEAVNRNFRYQLTAIGGAAPNLHISREIANHSFEIAGGKPGLKVSWQVTGIRRDPLAESDRIPVEVDKPAEERGTYLHPQAYGAADELALRHKMEMSKPSAAPLPSREGLVEGEDLRQPSGAEIGE